MACPICGQNCNKITPAPGAGLSITRLKPEGANDMAKVMLSKERMYVTADRSRAVKMGDPDAAILLVAKGSSISPAVAKHYGIETYEGEAVSIVRDEPGTERERMVTTGTAAKTAQNYEEMRVSREVREHVGASVAADKRDYAGSGRQAALMADGIINQSRVDRGLSANDGSPYGANAVGLTNLPEDAHKSPELTEYAEAGSGQGQSKIGGRTKDLGGQAGDGSETANVPDAGGKAKTGQDGEQARINDANAEAAEKAAKKALADAEAANNTPNK